MRVKRQYYRLKKGLGNRDLKTWLQNQEIMYANAKMLCFDETLKNQRPQRDFLVAVVKYKFLFNNNYLLKISNKDEFFKMQRIIEKVHHLTRLKNIAYINPVVATFETNATLNVSINLEVNTPQSTFNEQCLSSMRQFISLCICGYKHL